MKYIIILVFACFSLANASFSDLMTKAEAENWKNLQFNQISENVMTSMLGTEYVGGTLDIPGPETCVLNLDSVDCVTFVEYVIAISRAIEQGNYSSEWVRKQVEFIRYRNGKLDGYESRLHYYSDWIANNIEKGVLEGVLPIKNFDVYVPNVFFMSKNPQYYAKLKSDPVMVAEIAKMEQSLKQYKLIYIPKEKTKDLSFVKTGDIIAIKTKIDGLDYSHVGFAKVVDGEVRLFHASSVKNKVMLDTTIYDYLQGVKSSTGITIVRPISSTHYAE